MNLKETLEKYPKAAELYYQWSGECLKRLQLKFALEVPEGTETILPEIDQVIIKSYGDNVIETNWRNLFTFFDDNEIYIVVDYYWENSDKAEWFYIIGHEKYRNIYHSTRIEAEKAAFTKAFNILEKRLNND